MNSDKAEGNYCFVHEHCEYGATRGPEVDS
jgi:hypothetical protein